jgi:hypothetical protein
MRKFTDWAIFTQTGAAGGFFKPFTPKTALRVQAASRHARR